jgi:predicted Mrr-cat superfamily restriction endonuclease
MAKLVKVVTHHENPQRAAELFAEEGVVAVGWSETGSIAGKNMGEIIQKLFEVGYDNPEWGACQLIEFREGIEVGDVIIAYSTKNIVALVGEVIGEYEFNEENKTGKPEDKGGEIGYSHQRKVRWWDKPRNFHRKLLSNNFSKKVALRGAIKILDYDVDVNKLKQQLSYVSHE